MRYKIVVIIIVGIVISGVYPVFAHEPPRYADDIYSVGKHMVYTQQMCDSVHATVIHTITTKAYGTIRLKLGGLTEWGYDGTIVRSSSNASLDGDILTWKTVLEESRIVIVYTGPECLVVFPVVEELRSNKHVPTRTK